MEWPPLGPATMVEAGILRHEIKFKRGRNEDTVWIYLPEKTAADKLPCVLIAPAGSHLFDGAGLGVGDKPEHLPYVRAGFVVVAYDIDGEIKGKSAPATLSAIQEFRDSQAGLVNQRNALDYALEKVPQLDAERIYVGGHSSAATHALLVAANEPRVKGVVAYAPVTNIVDFIGGLLIRLDEQSAGLAQFLAAHSPNNFTAKITVPTFIFQAKDDDTVDARTTRSFITKLKKTNQHVTYVEENSGGHYRSMIDPGIARGIVWLKNQGQ